MFFIPEHGRKAAANACSMGSKLPEVQAGPAQAPCWVYLGSDQYVLCILSILELSLLQAQLILQATAEIVLHG